MENKQTDIQPEVQHEESIFSPDEFSLHGYDKHIRQARNAIFFVAGLLILNLIILGSTISEDYEYLWLDIIIWGVFIAGFIFLGFWTK
jgi:hypothetical protein